MDTTTSSFKYVEYTGDDAPEVLVTLLMNLSRVGLEAADEVHEGESITEVKDQSERVVGFVPNADDGEDEDE